MNCFVIMPFDTDFDDVYSFIKATVESATKEMNGRCFRLDENRAAGRITDRLLAELRTATICVVDISEHKPNVMWELGFAMALEKPTIIVTQNLSALPFDIKDMQSIGYDRTRLSSTLERQLKQSVIDTVASLNNRSQTNNATDTTIGNLLTEVSQLKNMLSEAVNAWKPDSAKVPQVVNQELQTLSGHWFNSESGSNIYSRVIRGELVSPYCYGGNDDITGIYFGWRRIGEYWFARYQWLNSEISGFTFLKMESSGKMSGAWWSAEQGGQGDNMPPKSSGVPASWGKMPEKAIPNWAEALFHDVENEGLASVLAKSR